MKERCIRRVVVCIGNALLGAVLILGAGLLLGAWWGQAVEQALGTSANTSLPTPQSYPLPETLANWQDPQHHGDYFDQIQRTEVDYLLWSRFPVRVYVEQPVADRPDAARASAWAEAVIQGVTDWNRYLPLLLVPTPDLADITIARVVPALPQQSRDSARPQAGRVRSAETRYQLYAQQLPDGTRILVHRCQIQLSPNQTLPYIQAAARHEMGHALGIWGHSPLPSDVMYFAQVRIPPPISARDINTLKRIYSQPTRLGGVLPASISRKG